MNAPRPLAEDILVFAEEDATGAPEKPAAPWLVLVVDAIHPHARICALADVFDALSQDRVYRPALPSAQIREIIAAERGRAFEPVLVDLFLAHHAELCAIRDAHPDSDTGRDSRAET